MLPCIMEAAAVLATFHAGFAEKLGTVLNLVL